MHERALHGIGRLLTSLGILMVGYGCGPGEEAEVLSRVNFEVFTTVRAPELHEISGMETADGPLFLVHNDDGPPDVFVLDAGGNIVTRLRLEGAKHRDWEDMTFLSDGDTTLLAIGDIGDNSAWRDATQIYFLEWPAELPAPAPGEEAVPLPIRHRLDFRYPDGPRDCEAMAYDPASGQILLLTKRDKPPRLYAIDARTALAESRAELEFLGTTIPFRPPTRDDVRRLGKEAAWISQPTGMDINADGTLAAVITYRSLFLFRRDPEQSWAEALRQPPREFLGPASRDEEAIAFDPGMGGLFISTEGHPAPIYHVVLPPPRH